MSSIDGNLNVDPSVLTRPGFDPSDIKSLPPDEINGSRDRADLLKQDLTAAGAPDSDGDATVFYSLLSDKQDKAMEEALVYGDDTSVVNKGEEPVLEADEDDDNDNDNVGGLGRFGYTKEQVDGWIAQGYSLTDIKNGIAASGEKNTEVTNELPNVRPGEITNELPNQIAADA
jgi:hypothetical protein